MICETCGKEHDGSYGSGRFCCQACARSFSTSKNRKEINQKISNSIKNSDKVSHISRTTLKFCSICNKPLKYSNKTGYCLECIRHSPLLKDYRTQISKKASKAVKNRVYWIRRNQISYAEKFWITVLDNNNIPYEHNYTVIINNKHHYFLDFYIEKNNHLIDLEIDGKQHTYPDRKAHDNRRDKYLTNKGYYVYRIAWNEINSDNGKLLMKSKIDDFINFYNNL